MMANRDEQRVSHRDTETRRDFTSVVFLRVSVPLCEPLSFAGPTDRGGEG